MTELRNNSESLKIILVTGFALLLLYLQPQVLCGQTSEVSMESLLSEMIDREAVASFPENNFRLKQESSYNRASISPEDTAGWFINHDFNSNERDRNFIRIEEVMGQKEWVLMDHQGPGAIVRTWMPFRDANKPGTESVIKIYLDGSTEPALEGNMLGLLDGTGIFPFPLAHQSLRSAVSFFPIPYAKSCKITVTERPFFYQFTYRAYPEGTKVKTFNMDDFKKGNEQIRYVCKTLVNPGSDIKGTSSLLKESLASGEEKSIQLPVGTAAVRKLSLKLNSYSDSTVMRSVVLKMEFDGHATVWCPIGDFFGSGIGINPFQGWYRSVEDDGTMSCRWVMPYQKSAKVSVLNLGEKTLDFKLDVVTGNYAWDENSMYFNAAWRGQYPVPTRPYSDWNYVSLKGRGVYVGDALTIMNPVEKWWGEGDEKIWIDGEDFPSIFGTGTEDYYGYSWGGMSTYFYEHPFHAQPRCHIYNKINRKTKYGTRNTQGYSTETRTRSLDVMPFESALQLDMEVWSWTDCDMGYGVGVYWYGDATTTSNRTADPEGVLNLGPSYASPESWTIDSQKEWQTGISTQTNLKIVNGKAEPIDRLATFKSTMKKFRNKRSLRSITLSQAPDWLNWEPVSRKGPTNLRDAPVALQMGEGNYWMFGLYNDKKKRDVFESRDTALIGFDMPLKTTPFQNQFDAPGGLKPGLGGYHAWQSRDMVNWVHHGPVSEKFSRWMTSAEYVDGKAYLYYDFPNDQDPHLYIDEDLSDGLPGKNMGMAFKDPSHGSDCTVIRDLDGNFHIIAEDWSPIDASTHAWDSPLATRAVSADGFNDFKIMNPPVDERTEPTGIYGEYPHPHWFKEDPDNYPGRIATEDVSQHRIKAGQTRAFARYEIHEPEQNAFGDWASICIGGQYYLFADYDQAGKHGRQNMSVAWFTSDDINRQFTFCGNIGQGHPDPDIMFAEGQFYLLTQTAFDYVSPGPWVAGVEIRIGVDTSNDGRINVWSKWQEVKEQYDYIEGFAKQVKRSAAQPDLSGVPDGYGFQFEVRLSRSPQNKIMPIIDKVAVVFDNEQ
ncbi:MAG: DUF2961 domain-containing protein [Bacteroidales bacterium]|nr:DUF2961 domain-containing protein [Bacteroidales bacterium]